MNTSCHPRESGDPVTTEVGALGSAVGKVVVEAGRVTFFPPCLASNLHRLLGPRFRGDDRLVWVALVALLAASPAHAAGPENWQVGFGERGSRIASLIAGLHDRVILIGAVIVLIVLGLLIFIAWRYRARAEP